MQFRISSGPLRSPDGNPDPVLTPASAPVGSTGRSTVPKLRTQFPETWIWTDKFARYQCYSNV